MSKAGRPKIQIDADLVLQFARFGSKTEEIADYFGCSTDTIQRNFAAELIKGRSDLRMSLRQWQLKAAKEGNIAMQIWLGKQMLGQTEPKQEHSISTEERKTIEEVNQLKALPDAKLIELGEQHLKQLKKDSK